MSVEDKESFPICKYNPSNDMICGIYSSVDEFKKHRNTIEYLTYSYDIGRSGAWSSLDATEIDLLLYLFLYSHNILRHNYYAETRPL